ncbi:uncharacterized protein [Henckelia pumila]|uniref:uncharacterized protein isoform X2 n=1 Tax=Henckelia pumila TaxID=405737 RepID=UPI003C6E3410
MSDNMNMIMKKDLQRSLYSEYQLLEQHGFHQSFEASSASKRPRVSPVQNGDLAGSSLLGLKLEKSGSFLDLVNKNFCNGKQVDFSSQGSYLNHKIRRKTKIDASRQKLKASNIAALLLNIGSWQKQTSPGHGVELAVKLYYAKRRMVWEILEGGLKSKIEIDWSDITAIRADISADTDEPGILEIQLNKQPSFSRENNPQPRRHTSWAPVHDFTGGQATITRRHLVVFPPRFLDRHYEQLLMCDERLYHLSQLPFPDQECPFFDSNMFGPPQHSLGFESTFIQPCPNSTPPAAHDIVWDQGIDHLIVEGNVGFQEAVGVPNQWNSITQGHERLLSHDQDYGTYPSKLDDSNNNLLGNNGRIQCSNEGTVVAEVEAMIQQYFNPTTEHLYVQQQH